MTPEMRAFMREMAEVMTRHNVSEMNIVEESHGWNTVTSGISFSIDGEWDEDGNMVRDFCEHAVHIWMTPETFREEADVED
jgi:hypothetical protein